jgi:hypothetical protein
MDSRTVKRLVLPAALVVTTFVSANSCKHEPDYCVDIENQADCDSAEGCGWSTEYDVCNNTCYLVETQAECDALDRCEWYPDGAPSESGGTETGGTETGGDGGCGEPFS